MIAVSGLFTTLVLSPLLPVALIVVGMLLSRRRHRAAATWLLSACAVLVFLLSLPATANILLWPLERHYAPITKESAPVGAVVVLGSGVQSGAPDMGGDASLTQTAFKRVVYGSVLAGRLGVPIIVSGGATWRSRGTTSEARVAREVLESLGTPVDRIHIENRSRTTWENARNVALLLGGLHVSRVALVTSASHMPRAMMAFARAGVPCVAAPTDYLSQSGPASFSDFLPSFGALRDSFAALQEYCGLVLYRARG